VLIVMADQVEAVKEAGLSNGVESLRTLAASGSGPVSQRMAAFPEGVMKALTQPLSPKEKKSYSYKPPEEPRVAFEGTYDDGQEFFQMTQQLSTARLPGGPTDCPLSCLPKNESGRCSPGQAMAPVSSSPFKLRGIWDRPGRSPRLASGIWPDENGWRPWRRSP